MKIIDAVIGSKKEFVVTETCIHGPGCGTPYQVSELSAIPLSYQGTPISKS